MFIDQDENQAEFVQALVMRTCYTRVLPTQTACLESQTVGKRYENAAQKKSALFADSFFASFFSTLHRATIAFP